MKKAFGIKFFKTFKTFRTKTTCWPYAYFAKTQKKLCTIRKSFDFTKNVRGSKLFKNCHTYHPIKFDH